MKIRQTKKGVDYIERCWDLSKYICIKKIKNNEKVFSIMINLQTTYCLKLISKKLPNTREANS